CKTSERKSRGAKAEARSRGVAKEKTLECGQIVWGLAFSAEGGETDPACARGLPCLILATGLNDGQIKVWEVQTGHLLFSLLGHQDVVRDLSFAPNGSLILVSASRDKTLRVWDLSRDGRQVQVLSGHVQWVYCCSISPDCSMLCSAAGEKSGMKSTPAPCAPSASPLRASTWPRWRMTATSSVPIQLSSAGDAASHLAALLGHSWDALSPWDRKSSSRVFMCSGAVWVWAWHLGCGPGIVSPPFLFRLLRIWALELRSPVAFAPMTNGLCCMYFPHGGFIATGTRDGHVQFWTAPRVLSSLKHLCRKALRTFLTTYQVLALPIPRKLKEFLTYRTF
ncbi:WD repeat and SOCS box-containing protein 2, partial [Mesitornis unicolor]